MIEKERLCVVSFDEATIAQDWCYHTGSDTLHDPKHKVQCVMLRAGVPNVLALATP